MPRVFLIRHGEPAALWGAGGGAADDPGLTARGLAQAETAARTLAAARPARILSSPLARCRDTAAPLSALLGLAPEIEPRVAEIPSPAVADRRAWLRETFPGAFGLRGDSGWAACGPGIAAWRATVIETLCGLDRDTAVFTHFIAINAAIGAAQGGDRTIVCRPAHASITELICEDGGLGLVRLGAQVDDGVVA